MPKRKRSPAEAPKDNYSSPICALCGKLFHRARTPGTNFLFRFYTVVHLEASATDCQSCFIFWGVIKDKEVSEQTRLSIEARHYIDRGISIILGRKNKNDYEDFGHKIFVPIDTPVLKGLRLLMSSCTNSEESWNQMLQWSKECMDNHKACTQSNLSMIPKNKNERIWPQRLLAIGGINESTKLCDTNALDHSTLVYMTLSHCWGVGQMPIRLLRDNLSSFQQGIKMADLPQTFRDAIDVTRKMGVHYLWIDSLCIIQDSSDDWAVESNKMQWVYKHSFLNLVAAASVNASGGLCRERDPQLFRPCIVDVSRWTQVKYMALCHPPEDQGSPGKLPILSRGWVFQELILPSRSLIFGKDQLHWYCRERHGTEIFPEQEPMHRDVNFRFETRIDWQNIHENKGSSWLFETWLSLLEAYSERKLTKFSDRLVAVAGLAAELGTAWNSKYLAGIWSHRLRRGLLWSCVVPGPPQTTTVPSWSWGSISGSIGTSCPEYYDGLANVLEAEVLLRDNSIEYGQVSGGHIQLLGPLCAVLLIKKKEGDGWEIDFVDPTDDDAILRLFATHDTPSKFDVSITWDDMSHSNALHEVFAYLAPLEISVGSESTSIRLEGLILVPTYMAHGEHKRWGKFDIWDRGTLTLNANETMAQYLRPMERIGDTHTFDSLEVQIVFEGYDAQRKQTASDMTDQEFTRLKQFMSCPTTNSDSTQDDPYCNGSLEHTLFGRYAGVLDKSYYSSIDAFLKCMYFFGDAQAESVIYEFFETYDGEGYFTFRIM